LAKDAHLRDLRYFATVAEELNFTRAAERLHVSQPALSKQIRSLETALRAQLFARDRRQVTLTAAGRALLGVARPLLERWDEGAAAVAEAAATEALMLRVGTLTAIGRGLYPSVIGHFAKREPGWRVELRSFSWADPAAGLRSHDTDAAFVCLPVGADSIAVRVLAAEPRCVALSAGHRLASRAEVQFADIADEPFTALPRSAGPLREFWLAADQRAGRPAMVAAEVTSADENFEIVATGAAVALVSAGNAAVYDRPGIVCVPVTDLASAQLAVGWRRGDPRPAVRSFVDACTDAAHALQLSAEHPPGPSANRRLHSGM
jgi:DNA-binding transcriptional LysR family regulator